MTRFTIAIAIAMVLAATVQNARADGPYEGDWRAGPMRIEVAVESWGGDCGPRPQSTTIPGGSTVRVTQSGDDLTFAGRPQRTTRGCWSENASVRRVSSRYESNTWTVVCRTPENDPRAEVGTYTLRAAGPDRLEFRDVSRYDWALNESRCVASITSTQTFQRTSGPAAQPVISEPEPAVPAQAPSCSPGSPDRITMRPSQATIEPGGRTCFVARVVDARGCAIAGRTPRFELRQPEGARARLDGTCFVAAESAAAGEGEFLLVAREGSLEAQARIRVRTPDLSDLIARRAEGGGAVSLDDAETISEEAARLAARSEPESRGGLGWIIGLSAIGFVMVMAGAIGLLVHGRRKKRGSPTMPPPPREHHAPQEIPVSLPALDLPPPSIPSEPKICPRCRRGYPPDAERCPQDGASLLKYAEFMEKSANDAQATKICPTCGARFPASTRFCGKDGATLVSP